MFLEKLKKIIKTRPWLYRILSTVYFVPRVRRSIKGWRDKHFDVKAKYWTNSGIDDIEGYWATKDNHSNQYMVEKLRKWDFKSFFEVGCNCGNRLYSLSKHFDNVEYYGIDINSLAVEQGNKWLNDEGIQNITLMHKRAEDISKIADDSYDIVFSWATLIYIRPKFIKSVLSNMLRISRKGVVLIEMQGEDKKDPSGLGVFYEPGNWKRDYVALFKQMDIKEVNIKCEFVSNDIWQPGGGGAACIQVIKQ